MSERWLPVPGWEGKYSISDLGRVKSERRLVERVDGRRQHCGGRILKPFPVPSGHLRVDLKHARTAAFATVHRLVLEAFVGPCPAGMEALHWDDDPTNNQLSNLRYGTRSENLLDMSRNGRHYWANKTHCPRNHEYTPENTYVNQGRRNCRTCVRDRRSAALKPRQVKTHCPWGHAYDEENTYWGMTRNGRPKRCCRHCARDRAAKNRAKKLLRAVSA